MGWRDTFIEGKKKRNKRKSRLMTNRNGRRFCSALVALVSNLYKRKKENLFFFFLIRISFSSQHCSNHPFSPVICSCSVLIRHQAIRAQLYKKRKNIKPDQLVGSPSLSASDKGMKEIIACTCFLHLFCLA